MSTRFRIKITETAYADLRDIFSHVARESPQAAHRLAKDLENIAGSLETFPNRSPLIPENIPGGTEHRHLIHGNYRLIFMVKEDAVFIVRFLHGARLLDGKSLKN